MTFEGVPTRVLVVPGLHGSGEAHWQTWLEAHFRRSIRVRQEDWTLPDVDRWATRIAQTIARQPPARWVAVAHSFGCLALARYLAIGGQGVQAALMVAPAEPSRFNAAPLLPHQALRVPCVLIGSQTDPWMTHDSAAHWAKVWGAQFINLGDVGHINVDSGFGPLPLAKTLTSSLIQRLESQRRIERAHALELSFAI